MEVPKDNPSVIVNGKINDVTIDDKVVGDATIDASLANRKFKITTLKLPVAVKDPLQWVVPLILMAS